METWRVDSKKKDHVIFLRYEADFKDNNLDIIFEFITYYSNKTQTFSISSCYAQISVMNIINNNGNLQVELRGGHPNKQLNINPNDVRVTKTLWKSIVNPNIKSMVELSFPKISNV